MIYVKDRSADSICDTELAFFKTNSSYMLSHFGGIAIAFGMRLCACLYTFMAHLSKHTTRTGHSKLLESTIVDLTS